VKKKQIGIVVSRFNEEITERLLKNCLAALKDGGVPALSIEVERVPGGYELPWAVQELALCGRFEVLIALGCILKGQTPQNDHISRATIFSLQKIALKTRVPCILGVITPKTEKQARARTKGSLDRGREAALAALEMLNLKRKLHGSKA
jgi:6,7-dimethyl-8-ribityllumazine synthase